jgi:hypothetical protein
MQDRIVLTIEGIVVMTKLIVSIACCALITPLAFAQSPKQKTQPTTASVQGVTVTGTIMKVENGEAASYQPPKTLVVRDDTDMATYVLNGRGRVVNSKGEIIRTKIRPGARVHVYFASTAGVRTIDHVVVD